MEIVLQKLIYSNIRDFHELEVSLTKDSGNLEPYHISLIQMPNGTGKTTTINLIRSLISGREFDYEEVMSYKPTNFDSDEGYFELSLLIDNIPHTIQLVFDYIDGFAQYKTSRPSLDAGGMQSGWNLPSQVKTVMTDQFTKLFIFDGELSAKLLNRKETEAESSMKLLYFLDRFQLLIEKINVVIEEERDKAQESKAHQETGLKALRTRLKNYEKHRDTLKKQQEESEKNIEESEKRCKRLIDEKDKILGKREDLQQKDNDLSEKLGRKKQEVCENAVDLLQALRTPSRFSSTVYNDLKSLANQMARLKLPKSTSAEFFQELSESEKCVCGTTITDEIKSYIIQNAQNYLSEDNISVMNVVKHSVRQMAEYEDLSYYRKRITNLSLEFKELEQQREGIRLEFDKNSRDRIKEIDDELLELKSGINEDQDFVNMLKIARTDFLKDHGLTWKENIPLCERKIEEYRMKIREAAKTVDFEKKADLLKIMIDDIIEKSMDKIKTHVVKHSNIRIERMMGNKDALISQIEGCIKIQNKDGISQGQSLAVAYSFLATLFEESIHQVPFVIDSPAGSLDIKVRREVSKLIPSLFDQLVIFIISSERGGFMQGIETYENIQYCTIFKNPENPTALTHSEDRKFFMNFHSDEELAEMEVNL